MPYVRINTYDSATDHTNISFFDDSMGHVGTYGANIGTTAVPQGGVFLEDVNRPAWMTVLIHVSEAAWTEGLELAEMRYQQTLDGEYDYDALGNNCVDFLQDVLAEIGLASASTYLHPESNVYSYALLTEMIFSSNWESMMYFMINDPYYQPVSAYQLTQTRLVTDYYDSKDADTIHVQVTRVEYETWVSPIAIDLGNDGIQTLDLQQTTAHFDYRNDGTLVKTAWVAPSDGLLVHDSDSDGNIEGLAELFGGFEAGDAFAKLRLFDTNGDDRVNASDDNFGDLQIWIDANSNGSSEDGELHSLASLNVTELSLEVDRVDLNLGHVFVSERSSAVVNGDSVELSDLYFRTELPPLEAVVV